MSEEFNILANNLLFVYLNEYGNCEWFENNTLIENEEIINERNDLIKDLKYNEDEEREEYMKELLKDGEEYEEDDFQYQLIISNTEMELCTTFNICEFDEKLLSAYWNVDYNEYYLAFLYKVFVNMKFKDCKISSFMEFNYGCYLPNHYANHFYDHDPKDIIEKEVEFKTNIKSRCNVSSTLEFAMSQLNGKTFKLDTSEYIHNKESKNFLQDTKELPGKIVYDTGCSCNRCYALDRIFRTFRNIEYIAENREFIDW